MSIIAERYTGDLYNNSEFSKLCTCPAGSDHYIFTFYTTYKCSCKIVDYYANGKYLQCACSGKWRYKNTQDWQWYNSMHKKCNDTVIVQAVNDLIIRETKDLYNKLKLIETYMIKDIIRYIVCQQLRLIT